MLDFLTKRSKKAKAEKDGKDGAGGKPEGTQVSTEHDGSKEGPPTAVQDHAQSSASGHHAGHHSGSHPHVSPVLNPEDEEFLQSILDSDDGPPPPLPPRVSHDRDWPSDTEDTSVERALNEQPKDTPAAVAKPEEKPEETTKKEKKQNRLSLLFTRHKKNEDGLKPEGVSPAEAEKEKKDLSRVLDRLNLSAKNNTVVSVSNETSEALQKFTQVFKDLVNGVPTAYDDLTKLFDDRDGALNKGFEKLPNSLKKLVTQLPEKLTSSIAPELLAAAAESQGMKPEDTSFDPKNTAEKLLLTKKIMELVTKPGAIVSMLRAIVETLKARWPAFIGMNVIWSVALTLLMLMLWYCHKRGREVRLEREQSENIIDGSDRIEELPDDPTLPAPKPSDRGEGERAVPTTQPASGPQIDLPRPPIGADAPTESRAP